MSDFTHSFVLEVVSGEKCKADCEFNEDGKASYSIAEYPNAGLNLEQSQIVIEFMRLMQRVSVQFGEIKKLRVIKNE